MAPFAPQFTVAVWPEVVSQLDEVAVAEAVDDDQPAASVLLPLDKEVLPAEIAADDSLLEHVVPEFLQLGFELPDRDAFPDEVGNGRGDGTVGIGDETGEIVYAFLTQQKNSFSEKGEKASLLEN